jgi:hypothetical protein
MLQKNLPQPRAFKSRGACRVEAGTVGCGSAQLRARTQVRKKTWGGFVEMRELAAEGGTKQNLLFMTQRWRAACYYKAGPTTNRMTDPKTGDGNRGGRGSRAGEQQMGRSSRGGLRGNRHAGGTCNRQRPAPGERAVLGLR